MRSLRDQLLVWLIGGVIGVGAVAGVSAYRNALAEANAFFDAQLRQTALLLRDQPFQLSGPPRAAADTASYDFVVQVWGLNGVRIYLSRPHTVLPDLTGPGFSTVDTRAGQWRVYAVPGIGGIIQVAQPMQVRQQRAAGLAVRTLQPFLWLVPVLAALIWFTIARSLAPLRRLTHSVRERRAESLDPLQREGLPEEVQPLVDALNGLLGRLSAVLERERAFLSDAAHELRTPLTALHLQMQALAQARTDPERREAMHELQAGVHRSIRLAEQLLSIARYESGPELINEVIPLDELVRETVAELLPLADAHQVDLGVTEAAVAARVRGDRAGLQTLMRNLIDNAVRYTPAGGRVDVVVDSDQPTGQASLRVVDTGPGISRAERERVFDRFYRAPGAAASGSGLGLAIVRAIAVAHNATIELRNGPENRGLDVLVTFPALPASP
jgi:two-component system OmpR family sensor kinase